MNITMLKISNLKPAEYNPRKISKAELDKLRRGIEEFGLVDPVIVNADMTVIGGHQRLKALKALKWLDCPCVVMDIPKDREKALNLALNRISGEWDDDLLAALIADLAQAPDLDLNLTGFDGKELDRLIADFELSQQTPEENEFDADAEAAKITEPRTKHGDLYFLGRHRLLCGDSTASNDVEKLLSGQRPDIFIIDPPYEIEHLYFDVLPPPAPGCKLLVFWDFKRFATAAKAALDKQWNPLYEFIWDNVTSWYTPNRPLARHKACGVFGDDPHFHFEKGIIRDGKERESKVVHNTRGKCNYKPLNGAVHVRTVEAFNNASQDNSHVHGKPLPWIEAIINGCGGEILCDYFGGGGSFLIVAEKTNRVSFTMELNPVFCDVIIKRYVNFTGNNEIIKNGEKTIWQ